MIADPLHGTSLRNFRTMGLKEEFGRSHTKGKQSE